MSVKQERTYWFLRTQGLRRLHNEDNHGLRAGELLFEGCKPHTAAQGDGQRIGGFQPFPAERLGNEALPCGLTCLSDLFQECLPIYVLIKVKWAKPQTCLFHPFLLSIDDL